MQVPPSGHNLTDFPVMIVSNQINLCHFHSNTILQLTNYKENKKKNQGHEISLIVFMLAIVIVTVI